MDWIPITDAPHEYTQWLLDPPNKQGCCEAEVPRERLTVDANLAHSTKPLKQATFASQSELLEGVLVLLGKAMANRLQGT